ncbi:hypothetical protein BD414DRAFT_527325 [Trametes punicea]|nr:hypothetical protein BD414DRAFT_527325 [Trametes punicea]
MEVDMQWLHNAVLNVVTNVANVGKVHEFTSGEYRKEVERSLSLEPGTLNAPEYKSVVHKIAKDYIIRLEEEQGLLQQETYHLALQLGQLYDTHHSRAAYCNTRRNAYKRKLVDGADEQMSSETAVD